MKAKTKIELFLRGIRILGVILSLSCFMNMDLFSQQSTLTLTSGTLNGNTILITDPVLTVSPGESIVGQISLMADNFGAPTSITPLAGTSSWGEHSTSYWGIDSWIPTGISNHTTDINLVAPDVSGTYYIYFAFGYEMTFANVMSLTNWSVPGGNVWNDGVDVADWDDSQAQMAIDSGYVYTEYLLGSGYNWLNLPGAVVRIQVEGPGCICGDADENGVVQAYDAALVLRYVLNLPPPLPTAPPECFDPDGNGVIQAFDAALVLYHVLGLNVPDPNCWGERPVNNNNNNLLKVGLKIAVEDIHQKGNKTEIVLGLSGFDDTEGVSAIQMDVELPEGKSNIGLSELPKDYLSGVNKIEGNTYRIGIVNPYGINVKEIKLVLTINSEESINILEFSNVYLNSLAQQNITVMLQGITLPLKYSIESYPNPFNPTTKIKYTLPEKANVEIKVFDILGREVITLINSEVEAGSKEVEWSGTNRYGSPVSSGIYVVTMKVGNFFRAIKVNLLK